MPRGLTVSDVIGITGHRNYPDRAALIRGLDNLQAREYVFGGARGVDSDALEYLSRTQPRSVRTVVVPNRAIDQPAYARNMTNKYATQVIELRNTGLNRYQLRNQNIVDRSTHLRAFYDFRGRGGTFNTINYARSKGKAFDVWPVQSYDERKLMAMSRSEAVDWIKQMKGLKVNLIAIKGIVLRVIDQVIQTSVFLLLDEMGFSGLKSLEQYWEQ